MVTPYRPPADGAMRVTLHGDLDVEGAAELRRHLPVLLARHRAGHHAPAHPLHVDLDLADVTFLDCSGARMLRWLDLCVRGHGGTFTIVRPSARVLRLLRLLEFDHGLPIVHDEDAGDVAQASWRITRLRHMCPDLAQSPN
ncbi:STAS domain-containing protein [Sphaerisporangium album]|nr:STAS domain-containing protein [Sphaerisporangium album]